MSHRRPRPAPRPTAESAPGQADPCTVLELVVKADAVGTLEAVSEAISRVSAEGVEIRIIHAGVGEATKSDVLMAATGSGLIMGFQVPTAPRVEEYAREQGVEIRLYEVIYELTGDAERIARSLAPRLPGERVIGRARVIALFKGSRKGAILGCEVQEGALALGNRFRIIDPAGPVHEGRIDSLHIGPEAVREARPGQQVGLKVGGFRKARVGDWVECFEGVRPEGPPPWSPQGGVRRFQG